ncbi:2-C-methyl-D-erythritol 2,4-cyclodiphosphate synthase [Alphaproteobacteria bacterium]|nr:2-C-methyl-D-erythritol 2,4-cyclodiphosphate synthase [Alphaproteobacteria bacterium]
MKIDGKNIILILLAGGIGSRLGSETSKQMIKIDNMTVLEKCICNFIDNLKNIKILIVSNYKDLKKIKDISNKYKLLEPIVGGDTRHESVFNALAFLEKNAPEFVLVHDSARPVVTKKVLENLIESINKNHTCVIPILPLNDSIRSAHKNEINEVVNRQDKVIVQTPQLCNYKELIKAHKNNIEIYEDESSLLMSKGIKIMCVEGDPRSLKITYENDFKLLESYLTNNSKYITMIGNGFDIHRFDLTNNNTENFIKLGGIKVPHIRPLIGHSDGDVLLHAITDSILGVINQGDIGKLFPPSDMKWKNSESSIFLKYASDLLQEANGKINNIDAVVICEKPKILDYSELIQDNIAQILNINPKRISIKGKTSESLGFIGRQEGIAAMVNTSIKINENMFDD